MKIGIVTCRRGWCEERLQEEAEKRGHEVLLSDPREIPISAGRGGMDIGDLSTVDRILFRRTVEAGLAVSTIAAAIERIGIPAIERPIHYTSSLVSKIGAVIRRSEKVRVPQTWALWNPKQIKQVVQSVHWPVLTKPDQGFGGRGILTVSNVEELYRLAEQHFNSGSGLPFVFQERISRMREYRVLVLNGAPIVVVVKCVPENAVVANADVGTSFVRPEELGIDSKEVEEVVDCAVNATRIHGLLFVGADVIVTDEGLPYVIECNRNPQFIETQQACPDVNIAFEVIRCLEHPEKWFQLLA